MNVVPFVLLLVQSISAFGETKNKERPTELKTNIIEEYPQRTSRKIQKTIQYETYLNYPETQIIPTSPLPTYYSNKDISEISPSSTVEDIETRESEAIYPISSKSTNFGEESYSQKPVQKIQNVTSNYPGTEDAATSFLPTSDKEVSEISSSTIVDNKTTRESESTYSISSKIQTETSNYPEIEDITVTSFLTTASNKQISEISSSTVEDLKTAEQSESTYSTFSELTPTSTTKSSCPNDLKISNLTSIPTEFGVFLQWDPPENGDCVQKYIINCDGHENYTSDTNITISGLKACQEYSCNVSILATDNCTKESVNDSFITPAPKPFSYSVGNITFEETEDSVQVTWDPVDDSIVKCVTNYHIYYWDTANTTKNGDDNGLETSYNLTLIGCINYHIMIKPKVRADLEGDSKIANYTVRPIPTRIPKIVNGSLNPNKTFTNIIWKTDTNKENQCPLKEIIVTCNNTEETVLDISNNTKHDFTYSMTVSNLTAFTQYQCRGIVVNSAGNSTYTEFTFKTVEDVPSAPRSLEATEINSTSFTIRWSEPELIPGILTSYIVVIENEGPNFYAVDCPKSDATFSHEFQPNECSYSFEQALPYHNYTIHVFGTDGAGNGSSATTTITTKAAAPENVKNLKVTGPQYSKTENYNASLNITFKRTCTNGPFEKYTISFKGVRTGYPDHDNNCSTTGTEVFLNQLLPERTYSFNLTVHTSEFISTFQLSQVWITKAGVPILNSTKLKPPVSNATDKAYFELKRDAFGNDNGEIMYYALILLSERVEENSSFDFWDGNIWPQSPNNSVQLTPNMWPAFKNGENKTVFVIGNGERDEGYCNLPLVEDTKYYLLVRALTSAAYKDSRLLAFKTDALDNVNLGLILGITFGLVALATLVAFIVILLRRQKKGYSDEKIKSSVSSPAPISCKKFADYYNSIQENNGIIKTQYTNLGALSKELALSTTYAVLPENKRKNRYINILPYDETRVKLNIDEDDEIGSDYINASYIKGYSNRVEYIATQGPLESTCKDFWKMILQENVTVIVMVSQFIEQSKEKCYQYFPNNHEKMSFGESLEIKCSTELHFGTYCVRTLQVRKNREQRNVYHMQFLEWPDFGVPQSTDNMLEFCHQVREKAEAEGGLIVVHCSAGVGRTGTLIALDILLQTINHHRDINIYKTVLDLRKQRINMVQTEKQYMFIYTCVKEYLENCSNQSNEQAQERTYENVDILRSSMKKTLIGTEIESAL